VSPEISRDSDVISRLRPGAQVAGAELRRLLAQDRFSSLWLTDPLEEGFPDTCLRLIPADNLTTIGADARFKEELRFWEDLHCPRTVELYDHGRDRDYYYAFMAYMSDGSLEDMFERGVDCAEGLPDFALEFASALRSVHGAAGAHGSLKPGNVFPVPGDGVRLSDFTVRLWLDEAEDPLSALRPHLYHPYRSPEQRKNIRNYDTRSDVYSYGLILLRIVTGSAPALDGRLPDMMPGEWPSGLAELVTPCLSPSPEDRPADGYELYELAREAVGAPPEGPQPRPSEPERRPTRPEPPPPCDPEEMERQARELIEQGKLEGALDLLEQLPPGTEGLNELLDEIVQRQQTSRQLSEEAVRLADMGRTDAALDAIDQACAMWGGSSTIMAIRDELASSCESAPSKPAQEPADALHEALAAENYTLARSLLEKALRDHPVTDEARQAARRFRHDRVRKFFLDSLGNARRLFALGHVDEAVECWREAARWLPPGPDRERLRKICRAARRGKLRADLAPVSSDDEAMRAPVPETVEAGRISPEVRSRIDEADGRHGQRRKRARWTALGLLLGALLALLLWAVDHFLGGSQVLSTR